MVLMDWELMAQDIPPLIYLTPLCNPLGHITPARPSTAARCGDRQASLWGGPCGSLHHGRDRASLSAHLHLETLHMPTLHLERRVKIQKAGHSVEVSRPRTVGRYLSGSHGVHPMTVWTFKTMMQPPSHVAASHSQQLLFPFFPYQNHASRFSGRQSSCQAAQGG